MGSDRMRFHSVARLRDRIHFVIVQTNTNRLTRSTFKWFQSWPNWSFDIIAIFSPPMACQCISDIRIVVIHSFLEYTVYLIKFHLAFEARKIKSVPNAAAHSRDRIVVLCFLFQISPYPSLYAVYVGIYSVLEKFPIIIIDWNFKHSFDTSRMELALDPYLMLARNRIGCWGRPQVKYLLNNRFRNGGWMPNEMRATPESREQNERHGFKN